MFGMHLIMTVVDNQQAQTSFDVNNHQHWKEKKKKKKRSPMFLLYGYIRPAKFLLLHMIPVLSVSELK